MLGDILSSAVSIWNAEENRDAAAQQQINANEFSREMSNTTYQRMVQDLNKAGLSPMLAYTKTGSAPSGSSSSGTSSVETPKFGETANRITQNDLTKAQVELAKSQRDVNIQTAKQVAEQARRTAYEVDTMLPTQLLYDSAVKGSQINTNTAQAGKTTIDARNNDLLVAPGSDPYWYRDIKKVGKSVFDAKSYLDNVISQGYNFLKGR
jgi:hypothetical protein